MATPQLITLRASLILLAGLLIAAMILTFHELRYPFEYLSWLERQDKAERIRAFIISESVLLATIPLLAGITGSALAYSLSRTLPRAKLLGYLLVWAIVTYAAAFLVAMYVGAVWFQSAAVVEVSYSLLMEGWLTYLLTVYAIAVASVLGSLSLLGTAVLTRRRTIGHHANGSESGEYVFQGPEHPVT